jgi:hypothetical protein
MAAKRAASGGTGKKVRRTGTGTPTPDAARPPDRERRFVDVDPWAVLLEGLMELPEEGAPAGRKGGKGR